MEYRVAAIKTRKKNVAYYKVCNPPCANSECSQGAVEQCSDLVLSDYGCALLHVSCVILPMDCLCLQFGMAGKVHYGVRDAVLGEADGGSVAFYLMSQLNVVI